MLGIHRGDVNEKSVTERLLRVGNNVCIDIDYHVRLGELLLKQGVCCMI